MTATMIPQPFEGGGNLAEHEGGSPSFMHMSALKSRKDRAAVYRIMRSQGLDRVVFYSEPEPDLPHWLAVTAPDAALCRLIRVDGDPALVFWVNNMQARTAFAHFCALPGHFSRAVPLGRYALRWLFAYGALDALLGATPQCYRHALQTVRAMGFTEAARIPGGCFIARKNRFDTAVLSICLPKAVCGAQHP